jgi:hypothetical protein
MPHFKKREIVIECQILTKLIKIKKWAMKSILLTYAIIICLIKSILRTCLMGTFKK